MKGTWVSMTVASENVLLDDVFFGFEGDFLWGFFFSATLGELCFTSTAFTAWGTGFAAMKDILTLHSVYFWKGQVRLLIDICYCFNSLGG